MLSFPRLTSHKVAHKGWHLPDLTIAVVADLHVCIPWTPLARVERIVAAVNALGADLILLPGDFLMDRNLPGRAVPAAPIIERLGHLRAPLGVAAVLGNHDWWDCHLSRQSDFARNSVAEALEGSGIHHLANRAMKIRHGGDAFWLVGFDSQGARKHLRLPGFHTPDDAFALMQGHRVTLFAGVPTMYFALLHHPEADRYDLSALSLCVSGGSAMPVEVMSAFDAKYGVNILEGYGLSETSPVASFNVLDRPKKPGSIGLPIAGVEFRLVDDHGHRVTEPGTPGEILIFGPNVMKGYYNKPEATAGAISKGWFRTGDVATVDEEGYYFIVDRKKDMIIRGGFNVYPREIEEVLYAHPAVAEAAVIGVPHAKMGEEVKAVIAFKPGQRATEEELTAHCREKLASYKNPRIYEFVDALPKGPTGKILKRELRG